MAIAGTTTLALVAGLASTALWVRAGAAAQDSEAFCGQTAPILVSLQPSDKPIEARRLVIVGGDQDAVALVKARGIETYFPSAEGDLATVLRLGMAAVVSSADIAHRALEKVGCAKLVVVPVE